MSMINHYMSMQKYEVWSTALAIESLESVPAASRSSTQYARALQVMAHSQLARSVWLARLQGRSEAVSNWFPAWTVAEVRSKAADLDRAWEAFLGSIREGDQARVVRYSSSEGVVYESLVGDIITHVYNHSTYHRGQVARLVTEAGGKRAGTDFITMTRRVV